MIKINLRCRAYFQGDSVNTSRFKSNYLCCFLSINFIKFIKINYHLLYLYVAICFFSLSTFYFYYCIIIIINLINIPIPTAGAQAFLIDYPQGERAIAHHAGPMRIGGWDSRPSKARRS
jgi:hypothetical protein